MAKFSEAVERTAVNMERIARAMKDAGAGGRPSGIGGRGGGGSVVIPPTVINTTVIVPPERGSLSGGGLSLLFRTGVMQ